MTEKITDTTGIQMNDSIISGYPISNSGLAYPYATPGEPSNQVKLCRKTVDDHSLASLSIEYRYALLNHSYSNAHVQVVQSNSCSNQLLKIPLESSLQDDLLSKNPIINVLIADMDQFNADVLFIKEKSQEILHLLAPDGITTQQVSSSGQLTQYEHHMISLDSPFHIFGTTTDTSQSG